MLSPLWHWVRHRLLCHHHLNSTCQQPTLRDSTSSTSTLSMMCELSSLVRAGRLLTLNDTHTTYTTHSMIYTSCDTYYNTLYRHTAMCTIYRCSHKRCTQQKVWSGRLSLKFLPCIEQAGTYQ